MTTPRNLKVSGALRVSRFSVRAVVSCPHAEPSILRTVVPQMIPRFVFEQSPTFVTLLESFCDFVERKYSSQTGLFKPGPYHVVKHLLDYADVDATLREFLDLKKAELSPDFPQSTAVNTRLLLKHVREFYLRKGTPDSFSFFFQCVFESFSSIYLPKLDILRASDGKWYVPYIIQLRNVGSNTLVSQTDLERLFDTPFVGLSSGVTGFVGTAQQFPIFPASSPLYWWLEVVTRSGNVLKGETLEFTLPTGAVLQYYVDLTNGVQTAPGRWLNDDGKLSSGKKLQDNHYWQDFSYEIVSEVPITSVINPVVANLHPAGFILFGRILSPSGPPLEIYPNGYSVSVTCKVREDDSTEIYPGSPDYSADTVSLAYRTYSVVSAGPDGGEFLSTLELPGSEYWSSLYALETRTMQELEAVDARGSVMTFAVSREGGRKYRSSDTLMPGSDSPFEDMRLTGAVVGTDMTLDYGVVPLSELESTPICQYKFGCWTLPLRFRTDLSPELHQLPDWPSTNFNVTLPASQAGVSGCVPVVFIDGLQLSSDLIVRGGDTLTHDGFLSVTAYRDVTYGDTNWGLVSRGASPSATSSTVFFGPGSVGDGRRTGPVWWQSALPARWPQVLTVPLGQPRVIDKVRLYSPQDQYFLAIEPDLHPDDVFTKFGMTDWTVEVETPNGWSLVDTVVANRLVRRESSFAPVRASAVRITLTGGIDNSYARVTELEIEGPATSEYSVGDTPVAEILWLDPGYLRSHAVRDVVLDIQRKAWYVQLPAPAQVQDIWMFVAGRCMVPELDFTVEGSRAYLTKDPAAFTADTFVFRTGVLAFRLEEAKLGLDDAVLPEPTERNDWPTGGSLYGTTVVMGGSGPTPSPPPPGTWTDTLSGLNTARINSGNQSVIGLPTAAGSGATAVVVGGIDPTFTSCLDTVEYYDPVADSFTTVGTTLSGQKAEITVVDLYDVDGTVLMAGGYDITNTKHVTADVWTVGGAIAPTTGNLNVARAGAAGIVLPDSTVLIVGGYNDVTMVTESTASCEIYDPTTGTFANTGSLGTARAYARLVGVTTGAGYRVLAIGGTTYSTGTPLTSCELFDPVAGTWSPAASMSTARFAPAVIATLASGHVLVSGGFMDASLNPTDSAETYNPTADTWSPAAHMITARACDCPSDNVLGAGGFSNVMAAGGYVDSALNVTNLVEFYDPGSDTWSAGTAMNHAHSMGVIDVAGGVGMAIGSFDSATTVTTLAEYYSGPY